MPTVCVFGVPAFPSLFMITWKLSVAPPPPPVWNTRISVNLSYFVYNIGAFLLSSHIQLDDVVVTMVVYTSDPPYVCCVCVCVSVGMVIGDLLFNSNASTPTERTKQSHTVFFRLIFEYVKFSVERVKRIESDTGSRCRTNTPGA